MKLAESAGVFAAYGAWRITGLSCAGRTLVGALASPDETNRTVAGILFVRAGERSVPLLREALARGQAVPLALRLLGDIGACELAGEIEEYAKSENPAIARAARDALQALKRWAGKSKGRAL